MHNAGSVPHSSTSAAVQPANADPPSEAGGQVQTVQALEAAIRLQCSPAVVPQALSKVLIQVICMPRFVTCDSPAQALALIRGA